MGKSIDTTSRDVMDRLTAYDWPGNVRELENTIERALILNTGPQLELGDWLPATEVIPRYDGVAAKSSATASLEEHERSHILSVLEMTVWRVRGHGGAAKILDINPSTLESRMKKLGVKRPIS